MSKQAYEYDFSGSCDPNNGRAIGDTFSVGVFQWIPKSSKKGLKRGKVIKRIRGSVNDPTDVYARARAFIDVLTSSNGSGVTSETEDRKEK